MMTSPASEAAAPNAATKSSTLSSCSSSSKRACDQCKFRKIRCKSLSHPCDTCRARGFECTYLKPQKKRGPVGRRLRQIQEEQHKSPSKLNHEDGSQEPPHSPARPETDASLESATASAGPESGLWNGLSLSSLGDIASFDQAQDVEYWLPDRDVPQAHAPPLASSEGTYSFMDFAGLPLVVEPDFNAVPSHGAAQPSEREAALVSPSHWPDSISEASLIPWLDVFFDRLHPTMPVLNRSTLFTRIFLREHRQDPLFGAMLLSLCAFAITQPILLSERATSSSRQQQAKRLMSEAVKMRSCSFDFGETATLTLEGVLTSFFLFGCLFGTNQHNAAWLRLREAVDLAQMMDMDCAAETMDAMDQVSMQAKSESLRVYMVLFVTERAYAIQRRHPINLKRIPDRASSITDNLINQSSHGLLAGIVVYNDKDAAALTELSDLFELFSVIDDSRAQCWNGSCNASGQGGNCPGWDQDTVTSIYDRLTRYRHRQPHGHINRLVLGDEAENDSNDNDDDVVDMNADIATTQKWLQNRLWCLCLAHSLLQFQSHRPELQYDYAIKLAQATLRLCQRLPLNSMEAHGIGLIEKLYDIAVTAASVLGNQLSASSSPNLYTQDYALHESSGNGVSDDINQVLRDLCGKYYKLFTILRGGNHPYLDNYVTHLQSCGLAPVHG